MVVPWPPRPLPTPPADLHPRFVLRPPTGDDAEALVRAWDDPEIRRWLAPPSADLDTAQAWIAGEWQRREQALALDLAIEVGNDLVGEIGFSSFDEGRRACLVGYWLAPEARGRGLASAALRTATAWLRSELGGLVAVVAECDRHNRASHAVADRAGYDLLAVDHGGRRVYVSRPVPPTRRED